MKKETKIIEITENQSNPLEYTNIVILIVDTHINYMTPRKKSLLFKRKIYVDIKLQPNMKIV
jgi:hypothetical protein